MIPMAIMGLTACDGARKWTSALNWTAWEKEWTWFNVKMALS